MFLVRALTGLHLDLRALFFRQIWSQGSVFCICALSGLFRSLSATNRSYRVDISLGSSHRVFLVWALTGLHLDLRALYFLNKLGHKVAFSHARRVWVG